MVTKVIRRSKVPKQKKQKKVDKPVAVEKPVEAKPKGKYNKETAKAYRDRIREFAIKGGYVPKERKPGTGLTEKRTSKSGKTYYYTPWGALTKEQKDARLAAARARMAEDRELAKKWREEHPEEKPEES